MGVGKTTRHSTRSQELGIGCLGDSGTGVVFLEEACERLSISSGHGHGVLLESYGRTALSQMGVLAQMLATPLIRRERGFKGRSQALATEAGVSTGANPATDFRSFRRG